MINYEESSLLDIIVYTTHSIDNKRHVNISQLVKKALRPGQRFLSKLFTTIGNQEENNKRS